MLTTKGLTVVYDGGNTALDSVSVTLDKGAVIGIIGPNGAGKSTFMKAVLDLIDHEGEVLLSNEPGKKTTGHVAYVEQKSHIDYNFPITVKECVSLGTYKKVGLFRRLGKKEWEKVDAVLEQVGLLDFKDRPIKTLSGGQFQRMLVARCLIQESDMIFLDEPFVGIDLVSEKIIVNILKDLRSQGKTILVVHHDLSKVKHYFDKVMILNKELIAYGDVDEVFVPANLKQAYGDTIFVGEEG